MIYHKLITNKFKFLEQNITEDVVIEALEESFKKCAFSTFPYIMENLNSKQALKKYNSGNCIALSIFVQNYLKKQGIISYLIPATIPNKYRYGGYLEISHVALAIPKNKYQIYIADSAFYFLNPILLDTRTEDSQIVYSKSIYSYEGAKNLEDYTTIDKMIVGKGFLHNDTELNQWQKLEAGTYFAECHYDNDSFDKWHYYLTEIINPDEAISTIFINIRKKTPFITTCFMDKQGVCKCRYYVRLNSYTLKVEKYMDNQQTYILENLSDDIINNLDKKLKRFLGGNLKTYVNTIKNLDETYYFTD